MTDDRLAELRALVLQHEREERDRKLRAGKVKPRTYREIEIFAADLLPKGDVSAPDMPDS